VEREEYVNMHRPGLAEDIGNRVRLTLDSANMGVGNGNVSQAQTTRNRATGDEW
jgi:hypothetical protein